MSHPISLTTTADILDAVPWLLGIHPTESLTGLIVDQNNRMHAAFRIDLPDTVQTFAETMITLRQITAGHQSVILVAYTASASLGDHLLLFLRDNWTGPVRLGPTISANPLGWAEVATTADDERQPYNPGSQVAAEFVYAGTAAPTSQSAASDAYTAKPDAHTLAATAQHLHAQIDRVAKMEPTQRITETLDYLDLWTANRGTLSVDDAAYLIALIGDDKNARDAALLHASPANAEAHTALWRYVAAHIDGPPALPILSLWALAAWLTGDGFQANRVLDRAANTEGGATYSLTDLIRRILGAAVPPAAWDAIKDGIEGDIQ